MADVGIKHEIKVDPAEAKVNLADVEEFEEDTDLQFPAPDLKAWFARVPPELWQAWYNVYKDAPDDINFKIGTMLVYQDDTKIGSQRIEMKLAEDIAHTQSLPKQYNLEVQTMEYNNSIVFSEKDLPGHRAQTFGRGRYLNANKPAGINKGNRFGNRDKPKSGRYSSAIPKETKLAPIIVSEASVTAHKDEKYYENLEAQFKAAMAPKATTEFKKGVDRGLVPGRNGNIFSTFTTTSKPNAKGKKKPVKEKAVRISKEALLDALYQCFRRFRYWPLKSLRNELKQPEAYIRTTLEEVATLVRSGDFAMTWKLKDEYMQLAQVKDDDVKEEAAEVENNGEISDVGTGDDMGEGDEDEDDEFEDVKMET